MSPEERAHKLSLARDFSRFGVLPEGPVCAPPGKASEYAPEGVFSAADLFSVQDWPHRAETVTMPNGKVVWVHPVSDEEARWLTSQAGREMADKVFATDMDRQEWLIRRARAYQAILACRTGPERTAPRVFGADMAEALQRNLPLPLLDTIVTTSDRLGQTADLERTAIVDFFDATRSWAQTWPLQSETGSLTLSPAAREAFVSCVSRVSARGFLLPADVQDIRELSAAA